ncbi:hypothetical protein Tco_0623193 [Tanacetum coccineum]
MQIDVLKQQVELIVAEVSNEDANHKFLRALPSAWSNLAMTMRTKPEIDTLSIDDLYNNLRVFEQEIKGASKTSTSAQNVAFVSQSRSSTNKVKSGLTGTFSTCNPSTSSSNIPEREAPAGFADEIDDVDIEEMDINWQIAMIAIRMKKFYKKTGRRVRIDGKAPGTNDGKKKTDSVYQDQEAGKQNQNQIGLLTMDDSVVNWGEHTVEEEETNHVLMANKLNLMANEIYGKDEKLKKYRRIGMKAIKEKEQLQKIVDSWKDSSKNLWRLVDSGMKYKYLPIANEIYEKDEKLKKYRRIGMKAVKEKEQLQKTLDSWKDSSKNLWRLINSGMSSNSKVGLGYEIQSNNEVLSYEEEMNFSVFNCSKEDSVGKPLYSRFIKTNDFKGVPHPLSGDYTPTPQEEIDESLYVYGKKGPQEPEPNVSDDRSSEYSTCQSNDSAGSIGTSSEHSVDPESEISSVPPEVYVSTPITTNEKGEGYSFTKKKCFVCGSLSHLIKDCDYYEKKMAREAEFKKQRVFNTGNGVSKPVWTNENRVNQANQFVPRLVQVNTGRTNINSVRPNINTGRTNVNPVRPRVNTGSSNVNTVRSRQLVPTNTSNSFSPKRPQVNQFNQRRHFSKSHSPVSRPIVRNTARMTYSHAIKGNWGSAVKTSVGYNWRNSNSNCDS